MSSFEILPIRSEIFIPENKVSAWVSKSDQVVVKDKSKEHEGVWVADNYTLDKKRASNEVWIFYDDDELGIDDRVLENNPLQGTWGYAPGVNPLKAQANEMWFFPPKSSKCKIPVNKLQYNHKGTWIKPVFKRDFSQLGKNSSGFINISGDMRIAKGEKYSVAGKWNMLGFNDDVVRGKKKPKKDDYDKKGPWEIYVRKPNGIRFPISAIPGNKIKDCKVKILTIKGIPVEEQRLSFNGVPLKDIKTLVGSGVRNGDTIDLCPKMVNVRDREGKNFSFQVDHEELVDNFKKLVENEVGTPVDDQRLFYKNQELTDGKTLSDFNLSFRTTVDLGGMIIFVQPHGGEPIIELDVEPLETLKSVKSKLKNRLQIATSDQRLSFEKMEMLSDSRNLTSYNVKHLDTLFMLKDGTTEKMMHSNDPNMIIFIVKEWNNHKSKFQVEPTDTILNVKKMIEASERIPVDQQRLTFKKKSVFNSKTLEQSKIKNKSTLHLRESQDTELDFRKERETSGVSDEKDSFIENYQDFDVVDVELPDKSKVTIPIHPSLTFSDIKDHIEKTNNIPRGKQRLFFLDNEIGDGEFITKSGLMSYEPILLKLDEGYESIEVKTHDGRSFFFDFDPGNETMDDLKMNIAKTLGLPVKDLHLVDANYDAIDENEKHMPTHGDVLHVASFIDIVMPDKSKVTIPTHPSLTFLDIKDHIEKTNNIPRGKQRLFFLDNKVEDGEFITKSGLMSYEPILLKLDEGYESIEVKTHDDRSFFFDFGPGNETMDDLKMNIAKTLGLPVKDLHLVDANYDAIDENEKHMPTHGDVLHVASFIDIVLPDKSKVTIPTHPSLTFSDIKDHIEKTNNIPRGKQRLFFLDNEVEDGEFITKSGLMSYEPILLKLDEGYESIEVKTHDGRSFFFDFDPGNETMDDLKMNIAKTLGLPVKDLHLVDANYDEIDENEKHMPTHGDVLHVASFIDIALPDKPKMRLQVWPKMTVDDLKRAIEERTGAPKIEQRIFLLDSDGAELDDTICLTRVGVKPGSMLEMRTSACNEINLRDPSGRVFQLMVDPEESINNVKTRIREKIGIPVGGFKLGDKNWNDIDDDTPLFETDILVRNGGILDIDPPELEIALPNTKKIKLKIFPTMTIKDVKKIIEEEAPELSTSDLSQRIFFLDDSQELEDSVHFEKLKFDHGQTIEMRSMMISIQHWDGKVYNLDVQSDWYIDDVRDRINEVANISLDEQNFLFNGNAVREELCLIKQGIVHDSTLYLEPTSIFVSTPFKKKPFHLVVNLADTVDSIKRRVLKKQKKKKKKARSSRHYCLVSGGVELDHDKTLEDCDVHHDDHVALEEFELCVMHWSGYVFHLKGVKRNAKVNSVKKQILKKEGIPMVDQKLLLDGRCLEDNKTIEAAKVRYKTILVLERPGADIGMVKAEKKNVKIMKTKDFKSKVYHDEIMPVVPDWKSRTFFFDFEEEFDAYIELIIMDWKGEQFTLDRVLLNNTVRDIKTLIFKLKGIIKKKQIITFDGEILHKNRTLREQNVGHRSILVLELSGGNTIAKPSVEKLHEIFTTLPTRLVTNINIIVNHWNGDSFTLGAAPTDYIDDVKDAIHDLKKIPFKDLRLSFRGQPTNDDTNLDEQGIVDGSILVLEPMQIFLQLPMTEELICLDVEISDKIRSIKKIVAKITRLPHKALCIMHGGDELGNTQTLFDCGIEHEDEIRVETFEIKIIHKNGEMFSVSGLSPYCTTCELKTEISKLQSIPIEQQILNIKGQVLNDVLTLKDQSIHHKAIILLDDPLDMSISPLRQKEPFAPYKKGKLESDMEGDGICSTLSIKINHWNGQTFIVDAKPTEKIDDIKERLFSAKHIPIEQERLEFRGQLVNDVMSIGEQGIDDNSTLIISCSKETINTTESDSNEKYLEDHQESQNNYSNHDSEEGVNNYLIDDVPSIKPASTSTSTTRSSHTRGSLKDNELSEKCELSNDKRRKKKKRKDSKRKKRKSEKSITGKKSKKRGEKKKKKANKKLFVKQ